VPALAPGETATVTRVVSNLAAGQYTASATADFDAQITESNEDNNGATVTFAVTQALNLQFNPAVPDPVFADSTMTVTVVAMDAQGAVIPDVQITLTRSWDPTPLTAVTNSDGRATFTFTAPAVGSGYSITAKGAQPGFASGSLTTTFSAVPPIQ
jgi:hypothetical protein